MGSCSSTRGRQRRAGMQFHLRPLVFLLALVSLSSLLVVVNGVPVDDVENQIETPPENEDLGLEELDQVDDLAGIDKDKDFDYQEGDEDDDDEKDADEDVDGVPEEDEEDEDDDEPGTFDVDYVVKRPTPEPACKEDDREEVMGHAFKCKEEQK